MADIDFSDVFGVAPLTDDGFKSEGKICLTPDDFYSNNSHRTNYLLYDTRTHRDIYELLLAQSNNLIRDQYVNRQGECCVAMIGAKGIGKTTSLKAFVRLCQFSVPNLYAIYVSFNNVEEDIVLTSSLAEIILKVLSDDLSVPLPTRANRDYSSRLYLIRCLKESCLKLILLVDELDQLYKSTTQKALSTLHDLAYFGNQPTGCLSVVVCGSSAMMEALITTNASPAVREEFPLLSVGAPNLNDTKFFTNRVFSSLPTDLVTVSVLSERNLSDETRYWTRLLAFAAGANARTIGRVCNGRVTGNVLSSICPDSHLSVTNTLYKAHLDSLRLQIHVSLYEKNKAMFDAWKDAADPFDAIGTTTQWEVQFQCLMYDEVVDVWRRLVREGVVNESEAMNLNDSLQHLSDRSWITIGSIVNSHPEYIYPYSLFQTFKETLRQDLLPTFREKLADQITNAPNKIVKAVANPRVLGAAVGVAVTSCCGCTLM